MAAVGAVGRRLPVVIPQAIAVSIVTFILVRLLPADPARAILGSRASESAVAALRQRLGLDEPVLAQYWGYLSDLVKGDWGHSFFTGQPVLRDLAQRTPATLELLLYGMSVAVLIGVLLGAGSAVLRNRGFAVRTVNVYSRLAGSFPDFWLGLLCVFVFFYLLDWAPGPVGRLGTGTLPPERITGMYSIDSLLSGDIALFIDSIRHLMLPVLVLGLIQASMVAKATNASVGEVLDSDFVRYGRACGLGRPVLSRYIIRNAFPPVLTLTGYLFVYLLGGAVLTEKVFAWGGIGSYAVDSVVQSDFAALQGFVLVAAVFTVVVYLVVDVIHIFVDPRISLTRAE